VISRHLCLCVNYLGHGGCLGFCLWTGCSKSCPGITVRFFGGVGLVISNDSSSDLDGDLCHDVDKGTWRALWKNRICSTTMKLRKSLVKPVTQQNISSCSVLPPEIVMQDAFNVILWTSADMCVVVHDDLVWKNRTARYSCRFSATSLALRVIFSAEQPNNML